MKTKYFFASLYSFFFVLANLGANCTHPDYDALAALYNATNGASWTNTTNNDRPWDVSNSDNCDPCSWYGIECSNGRVTEIDLRENNLTGTIPNEIGNLVFLGELWLAQNKITGNIPTSIGNLSNLYLLYLYENQFSGTIPNTIGNLNNLAFLCLYENQLSGSIPVEIGNLNQLQYFWAYENDLTGGIPAEIGNLTQLIGMRLQNNQNLGGSIPTTIGNLGNLEDLVLWECGLTGTLPTQIGNLNKLKILDFWGNSLSGNLPNSIGNLVELEFLSFGNNQNLNGAIPSSIGNLKKVTDLRLNNNQFTSLPPEIGDLTALKFLYVGQNNLMGSIPPEIGNLANLEIMRLQNNPSLSGMLPASIGYMGSIKEVSLHDTNISGCFPGSFSLLCETGVITYFGNTNLDEQNFNNFCTSNAGACMPLCSTVQEDYYALVALYKATNGDNWTNKTNWDITGNSCDPCADNWFGISCENNRVTQINLGGNMLQGSIPSSIAVINNLKELNLATCNQSVCTNKLTGTFPNTISSLTQLEILDLSGQRFGPSTDGNQINGEIPIELYNLSNLKHLYLDHNQFEGEIAPEISMLSNLITLNLSYNFHLSGSIPNEIVNLTSLESLSISWIFELSGTIPQGIEALSNLRNLSLSGINLTGTIPTELGMLNNLHSLALDNNDLTGTIPTELGNLGSLSWLSLQGNQLTGTIPKEFGNIEFLRSLYLNANQLTGEIPSELGDLEQLDYLNLSNNGLTGEIPLELGNLDGLMILSLNDNELTGCIPNEIKILCANNATVDFSNNQLENNNFATFCSNDEGNCSNTNSSCPSTIMLNGTPTKDSTYHASNTITSTDTLNSPLKITYKAGHISLLPGFEVKAGATFLATIKDCNSSLQEPAEEVLESFLLMEPTSTRLSDKMDLKVFPNPFSYTSTIQFDLATAAPISIQLYDLNGRQLKSIVSNTNYGAGSHQLTLESGDLQAGIYYLNMRSEKEQIVRKVMIVK